ncbi:hypothetical protein RYX36_034412 [Vicia faba]
MHSSTFFDSSITIDSPLTADFPLPPIRFLQMPKPEPIPPHLSQTPPSFFRLRSSPRSFIASTPSSLIQPSSIPQVLRVSRFSSVL